MRRSMGRGERGARPGLRVPWRGRAVRWPDGWGLLVPLVFLFAGLLFAASASAARGTDLRGGQRTDLADLIRNRQRVVALQLGRVRELRREVDGLRAAVGAPRSALGGGGARTVGELEAAAQLRPVYGPALRVTLTDAKLTDARLLPEDVGPDDLVVHQQDLQAVLNAMWAGGAVGVQLMDQRVISTSAVRCVGNVLILQGRTYSPPYVATAVGDVAGMKAALAESTTLATYRFYVDYVGLGYAETELGTVTLPAYEGSLDLRYASTDADESKQAG